MKKKLTALFLAMVMCMTMSAPAFALNISASTASSEDFFISEEVAAEIAKLFISDASALPDTSWDETTAIENVAKMYDTANPDSVVAYSFELTEGYIVVSAYGDVNNIILEWSDSASPVYASLNIGETDKIVYGGSLYYYKDTGDSTIETLSGTSITRNRATNVLASQHSISNVPASVLAKLNEIDTASTFASEYPIEDPIDHADTWYNGPYTSDSYTNKWENYVTGTIREMSDFKNRGIGYHKHCGPTAITNMILIYDDRYGISGVNASSDYGDVFDTVAAVGRNNMYYINSDQLGIGGTANSTADDYIVDAFAEFNVTDIDVLGRYSINYSNVRTSLQDGCLLYAMLNDHDYYGDHHVVGYAYTRLISSSDDSLVTYLKIADGWDPSPRYIDITSSGVGKYWEVTF